MARVLTNRELQDVIKKNIERTGNADMVMSAVRRDIKSGRTIIDNDKDESKYSDRLSKKGTLGSIGGAILRPIEKSARLGAGSLMALGMARQAIPETIIEGITGKDIGDSTGKLLQGDIPFLSREQEAMLRSDDLEGAKDIAEEYSKAGANIGATLAPGGSTVAKAAGAGLIRGAAAGYGGTRRGASMEETRNNMLFGAGTGLLVEGGTRALLNLPKNVKKFAGREGTKEFAREGGLSAKQYADIKAEHSFDPLKELQNQLDDIGPVDTSDDLMKAWDKKIVDSEDIIKTIKKETKGELLPTKKMIKELKKELAEAKANKLISESQVKTFEEIIKTQERAFKRGMSVERAINTVRAANKKFGSGVVSTDKGAVRTVAEKVKANALRNTLKETYPETVGTALRRQEILYTLKPIVGQAAGKQALTATGKGLGLNVLQGFGIPKTIARQGAKPKILSRVVGGTNNVTGELSKRAPVPLVVGASGSFGRSDTPIADDTTQSTDKRLPEQDQLMGRVRVSEDGRLSGGSLGDRVRATRELERDMQIPGQEERSAGFLSMEKGVQAIVGDLNSSGGANFNTILNNMSLTGSEREQLRQQAIQADINKTGGKNIANLLPLPEEEAEAELTAAQKKSLTELQKSVPMFNRLKELSEGSPTGLEGSLTALTGKIPGVGGGDAEELDRVTDGLAKKIANAFAGEVGVATDRDVKRWKGLMPKPGDTADDRQRALNGMLREMVAEAGALGMSLEELGIDISDLGML